jgi:hypothetical protein
MLLWAKTVKESNVTRIMQIFLFPNMVGSNITELCANYYTVTQVYVSLIRIYNYSYLDV